MSLRRWASLAGRPGLTSRSIRRIVKEVALRNGTRRRRAYAFAAIVHAVLANAVQQPVGALRMVNHRSDAKRVSGHLLEILWHKLLQTWGRTPLLALVTTHGEFSRQQALMGDNSLMLHFRLSK